MTLHDSNISQCRICERPLFEIIDLGLHPSSNVFFSEALTSVQEFPIIVMGCTNCGAAQLSQSLNRDSLYKDYHFATPESETLTKHYAKILQILKSNADVSTTSKVLEIGSNNGSFLTSIAPQVDSVLGIDPCYSEKTQGSQTAIRTIPRFFDDDLSKEVLIKHGKFDLIVARHCLAHSADLKTIVQGIDRLLEDGGTLLIENTYWPDLIKKGLFDQLYHEHIYYHSLRSIKEMFSKTDIQLSNVYRVDIQGSSMIYLLKKGQNRTSYSENIDELITQEGSLSIESAFQNFEQNVYDHIKKLKEILDSFSAEGKTIYGYGASAKAVTLLKTMNMSSDQIPFIVDSSVEKIGKYLPNSGIEIISEEASHKLSPDYYLLMIWNYSEEVIKKVRMAGNNHSKFIIPFPEIQII